MMSSSFFLLSLFKKDFIENHKNFHQINYSKFGISNKSYIINYHHLIGQIHLINSQFNYSSISNQFFQTLKLSSKKTKSNSYPNFFTIPSLINQFHYSLKEFKSLATPIYP